jgi:hypothetical protein
MTDDPSDSVRATIGDVFRVVNEIRTTTDAVRIDLDAVRVDLADFRAGTEERFDEIDRRLGGQTESALNVALHVLGDQRGKLRELVDWANTKGAKIEPLP